jgi:hypothetical protein
MIKPVITALLIGLSLNVMAEPAIRTYSKPGDPGWFPYVIPGLATPEPTLLDLSFLNELPAGKSGFIRAEGEKFVDGAGREVRFWGTNIVASACFPEKSQSPAIARQLARLGVNIVRFHFLESEWAEMGLYTKKSGFKDWNDEAQDRFDYLYHELREQGIYANINLHVGRIYPGDPFIGPAFSKGLDNFHRPYIDALKDYSRKLLTHRNPYTGLIYKEDPALAVVEINNENSLAMRPWWLLKAPQPFLGDIQKLWQNWLRKKFSSDTELRAVFGLNTGWIGENLFTPGTMIKSTEGWWIDTPAATMASLRKSENAAHLIWEVKEAGTQNWAHQLNGGSFSLQPGKTYCVKLKAKAKKATTTELRVMMSVDPWKGAGLNTNIDLTPEWKSHEFFFTADKDLGQQPMRLTLSANNTPGVYEIASATIQETSAGFVTEKQTLKTGNIPLPDHLSSQPVQRQWFEMLAQIEVDYAHEISTFLKTDLSVRSLVSYSQVSFGSMLGARREFAVSDFVDNHGYWQHPWFPRVQWDLNDWIIENDSQLAMTDGATLTEMALHRPAGKPYTISEFDIPAPNDHSCELAPTLAAYGCAQGWNGIYTYNYCDDLKHYTTDKMTAFFATLGHSGKLAFYPSSALIFRRQAVPSTPKRATFTVNEGTLLADTARLNGDIWSQWRRIWSQAQQGPQLGLNHRVDINIAAAPEDQPGTVKIHGDGEPAFAWDVTQGLATVDQPTVLMACGHLSEKNLTLGAQPWKIAALHDNGHATLTLVSVDGKPFSECSTALLTAIRRAENPGLGWNERRTCIGNIWGQGPVEVLGLNAEISLPGGEWKITSLDSHGRAAQVLAEKTKTAVISPEHHTVWYWLTRAETK